MTKTTYLFTIPEAAGRLRISVRTLHRYIEDKKLKAVKFSKGHLVRITEKELEAFIKRHTK